MSREFSRLVTRARGNYKAAGLTRRKREASAFEGRVLRTVAMMKITGFKISRSNEPCASPRRFVNLRLGVPDT
jgi:hypothetical protein